MAKQSFGSMNYRVLAVDDDPLILKGYEKLFAIEEPLVQKSYFGAEEVELPEGGEPEEKREEFYLTLCDQGEDAVDQVWRATQKHAPFAAVLLDMMMPPGIDGLETAKRIRQIDPEVQIIFVTAHTDRHLSEIFQQVGGPMLFFNKPYRGVELYQTVRNCVWSWNQGEQLRELQQTLEYRIDLQTKRLTERVRSMELLQKNALAREEQSGEMRQELYQLRARRDLQLLLSSDSLEKVSSNTAWKEQSPLNLLLVDDSATVRASYQAMLESVGYKVSVAQTVDEGMLIALDNPFDLALIDYYMPGGNGDELIERLRSDRRTDRILPFLFTGSGDELLASEAGAVHWINKDQERSLFLQKMELVRNYLLKQRNSRSDREQQIHTLMDDLAPEVGVISGDGEQRNRRILLVDDEAKNLDMLTMVLGEDQWRGAYADYEQEMLALMQKPNGGGDVDTIRFDIAAVERGEDAVSAALKGQRTGRPFAVAMIDMRMPNGISGLETARQLRGISPDIDIIIMTAYSDYSLEEIRGVLGEQFSFITKPFKEEDVLQRVVEGCARWEITRQGKVSMSALVSLAEDMDQEILRRKETEQELENANRTKDEFLSSMSHELRTPLSTIIGYNELLLDDPLQETQRGMLENSLLAGNTLLRLVNDILDMSKIRAGKFDLSDQPFDLQKMLRDISQLMNINAAGRGVKLTLAVDEALEGYFSHRWVGDEMRISQILFNLLSNAIKFSDRAGEVTLKVGLVPFPAVQVPGISHFEIQVQDRGIGMPQSVVERLFTPFEQAESSTSRRFGGTGLGLFISQQLAQMMGGEIKVESVEGVGSRFTVNLPMKRSEIEVSQEQQADTETAPQLQGCVLLAEDTLQLQRLAKMLLERCGVEVDVANDGREAIDRARQRGAEGRAYDLILMDMQMPEVDGIEATRQLKEMGCMTPIVALTANVMQHHQEQFYEAGCEGFLSKPIRRSQLYSTLCQYMKLAESPVVESEADAVMDVEGEDLSELLDEEMMAEFWDYIDGLRRDVEQAWGQGDWALLRKSVHAVKGMGSSYGQPKMTEVAGRLQDHALAGDRNQLSADYEQLIGLMQQKRSV